MAIIPRTPDEIRQNLIAYLVSTGALTSIDEGDVVGTIFGGVAEEISALEHKLKEFVNGHLLSVSNDDLDDRVAQIPNFTPRRSRVSAVGGSVRLIRSDSSSELTLAPGAVQISNPNTPAVVYTNRYTITMLQGVDEYNGGYFYCLTPGVVGNAPVGAVTSIVAGDGLTSCRNSEPFAGGLDREIDSSLRQRALSTLLSLARSQASAIEALALNFTDSNGAIVTHAKAYEYSDYRRGYTELVVSNGGGMPGSKRAATPTSGILPDLEGGSRYTFWFEGPAATFPVLSIGDSVTYGFQPWWTPIEEKGVAWTNGQVPGDLVAGAAWSIGGYEVYQGWIAEFQELVNRTCAAAGTRVRVIAAELQAVRVHANVIVESGFSVVGVLGSTQAMIIEFFNRLGPGEPAFVHKLHDWVAQVPGLRNIIFYDVAGGIQRDFYTGSPRKKLTTSSSLITLR